MIKASSITPHDVSTNLRLGLEWAPGGWTCAEIAACRDTSIQIFQLNAYAGFRFRRNYGDVTLGLLDINNQDYKLNALNYYNELPRQRTLAVRVRLNF